MRKTTVLFCAMACAAADFTYTEKTEMTGGSLKKAMGALGRFGPKQPEGPTTTVHRISNGKMSTESGKTSSIIDASAGTMTAIDHEKKEYTVITFDEMLQAMNKMADSMAGLQGQNPNANAELTWKASVDNTGATRQVVGVTAKQSILKLEAGVSDKASGQSAGLQNMEIDSYRGHLPGDEAFKEFQAKMAARAAWMNPATSMAMMRLGRSAGKGLEEAAKKMAEVEGTPLYTTTRMRGAMGSIFGGLTGGARSRNGGPGVGEEIKRDVKDEAASQAGSEAGRALGGRLGGRLGGLGGRIGRRTASEATKDRPKQEAPAQAPAAAPGPGDDLLMETVSEVVSHSNAPIDPAIFAIPAGYKQTEHPMKKMGRQ